MEGRREEYSANCPTKAQAHLASVEEVQEGENIHETRDESLLKQEFAAMSLNLTNDIDFTSYSIESPSAGSLNHIVLLALPERFNTALDSACTNHIICDRTLFQMYDTNGAIPVKTANCGFLTTLAIGDVKFHIVIKGQTVIWTLKNCLHAPDVPINLISVSALQEHHMSITFSFQKTTIAFPTSHPQLSGLSFDAKVIHCLSLLHLDYITSTTKPPAIVYVSFQVAPHSIELWRRQFGHLGQEATCNMLTGDYATGITYKPSTQTSSKCIPCLIGKAAQAPFSHHARRASKVCDLIYIDTCGPFPITPQKEAYFTTFLDDVSNFGSIALLVTKDKTYQAWRKTEASWTLKSGNPIRIVRLNGAKEFTQGPMSKHMVSKGIDV
jgi:hypothetical protein